MPPSWAVRKDKVPSFQANRRTGSNRGRQGRHGGGAVLHERTRQRPQAGQVELRSAILWITQNTDFSAVSAQVPKGLTGHSQCYGPVINTGPELGGCVIPDPGAPSTCREGKRRGQTETPATVAPEGQAGWRLLKRMDRGNPGRRLRGGTGSDEDRRGCSPTQVATDLRCQIPQRIWIRGRRLGQPERRPLAMRARSAAPLIDLW